MKTLCSLVCASLLTLTGIANAQTDDAPIVAPVDATAPSEDTSPVPVEATPDTVGTANDAPSAVTTDVAASKEMLADPSLAALGVGQYGKRSEMFVLWENAATGAYIKPILWVSGSLLGYFPTREGQADLASRPATMLVSRFGFEGALNEWASFKLELQRDLGFGLATNGPQGTGVFEGTASLQARENYVSLHRWGLTLNAGIVTDPASVDFITPHVLGMFGMDPFTRDYLLNSGFNLGQGVMVRYEIPGLQHLGAGRLVVGFQFTSGNPLTSSLSYAFGGQVTQTGTLFSAPLRSLANGVPGTNIIFQSYSPSLTYSIDFAPRVGLDLRAMAQFMRADIDSTTATDVNVNGTNYRATARLRLPYVNLMGGFSRRVNQQIALPDLSTRLGDNFEGTVWSLGGEFNYGPYGIGAHYASVKQEIFDAPVTFSKAKYFNVGASYQFVPSFLSAQLRYASVAYDFEGITSVPTNAKMISASLVLTI